MAYSTVADIRAITPFKNSTLISDALITQKIAEADDFIKSYLSDRYVLPLSSTPNVIVYLSKGITSAMLYREQNMNVEIEPGVGVSDWWDSLVSMLTDIQKGKLRLLDSTGVELETRSQEDPSFYPNNTSSSTALSNNTAAKASINQVF